MSDELNAVLEEAVMNSKKGRMSFLNKILVGLAAVIIAMLMILTVVSVNVSSILSRRSPVTEYHLCYNTRDALSDLAYQEYALTLIKRESLEVQEKYEARWKDAVKHKLDASDKDSSDACPSIKTVLKS